MDFLLYSNLFIAGCAAGFQLTTYRLLGAALPDGKLLLLTCGGTLFLYLALRYRVAAATTPGVRGQPTSGHSLSRDRLSWVSQNRTLALVLMVAGAGAAFAGFMLVSWPVRAALIPAAMLALAYGWPFLPVQQRWRLRRQNFLKIFLISGVWAWIAVVLPAVALGYTWHHPAVLSLFASRFFFVAGCTLPFDIRDIEQDRVYRLQTVATAFGVSHTKTLSWCALALSWVLLLPLCMPWPGIAVTPSPGMLAAVLIAVLVAAFGVQRARPDGREYLYLGWLDGTALLQWLLVEGVVAWQS